MLRAAIYGRYSDDEQRPTSIDDQVRRTRQKALQLGYEVRDEHIYTDAAVTGQDKGLHKRAAYEKLIAQWEAGAFDAIFVDELSRLARSTLEFAHLQQRIERTHVRVVSTDGTDTSLPGWQLHFGMSGVIAAHFVRETSHRVKRGMEGQLERGYMIARAAYGYRASKEGEKTNEGGTVWQIEEIAATHVRTMYNMRYRGDSFNSIAEHLNRIGARCPHHARDGGSGYWRPATVVRILENPIYRGVFVFRGSSFTKARAKRERTQVEPVEYARPELRLVDDAVWRQCNAKSGATRTRGGTLRLFTGLVLCSRCFARLSVTGQRTQQMYCSSCAQRQRVSGTQDDCTADYVSARALEHAVKHLLSAMFDGDRTQLFRDRLKARLDGGHEERMRELTQEIARADRQLEQMAQRMRRLEADGDEFLERAYRDQREEKKLLVAEFNTLENAVKAIDTTVIAKQIAVDPLTVIPMLFSKDANISHVNTVLGRVFPKIVFNGNRRQFLSSWTITACAGAVVSDLTQTLPLVGELAEYDVLVESGARRPTPWRVTIETTRAVEG